MIFVLRQEDQGQSKVKRHHSRSHSQSLSRAAISCNRGTPGSIIRGKYSKVLLGSEVLPEV